MRYNRNLVANRTCINNVLYTNEDAPEPVLIHVPPIIRLNGPIGKMYFNIEITYMLEVECYYDLFVHPQKVPLSTKKQTTAAMHKDFRADLYVINNPNKNFHGDDPKGLIHGRGIHVFKGADGKFHGMNNLSTSSY